jgi:hypothetical protein
MAEVFEQVPFSDAEFAENPEPRCPCLLLLDNSMSMRGRPIKELNEGLSSFRPSWPQILLRRREWKSLSSLSAL